MAKYFNIITIHGVKNKNRIPELTRNIESKMNYSFFIEESD